jgi:hypothetical protein
MGRISYTVLVAPHDMTDNRIRLDRGYLVDLEVLDIPVEFWCKELVAPAFYPFGSVVILETRLASRVQISRLDLSLCPNLRARWLARRIMLNAGREGIMFKVIIKGYLDLNDDPSNPSSQHSSLSHTPIPVPTNHTVPDPFSPRHNPIP